MAKVYSPTMTLAQSLNVTSNKPLDTRTVVAQYSDLTNAATTFGGYEYEGMLVYVQDEQRFYVLSSIDTILGTYTWIQISLPEVKHTDKNKILKTRLINGVWTASWEDETTELPSKTNKSGYFLRVNENGNGVEWVELDIEHPRELPETIGDIGQVLKVGTDSDNNKIVKWEDETQELPTIGPGSAGKVLTVSSDGTSTEWTTVDTELMKNVTTEDLFSFATHGLLKPGMKYRITNYGESSDGNLLLEYQCSVNGQTLNIGAELPKFDIIATASSERTIFDDVELVLKKNVTSPYDYTKYEAKYDLFGNTRGRKYNYIAPDGIGVIYYMKDEFGNEASFDFENIGYVGRLVHGSLIHTFEGIKYADLRQYGHIQNVRIKHSPKDLPSIVLLNSNAKAIVDDVEFDNCRGIYIKNTDLRHTKISNSNNINIDISTATEHQYWPLFENLNICNNNELIISCTSEFNGVFENTGGMYINNFNILPSSTSRVIDVAELFQQTCGIVIQGLYDSNIVSKLHLTEENSGWIIALTRSIPEACVLLFTNNEVVHTMIIESKYDTFTYDSIVDASKIIKPFDIFNPINDDNSSRIYTLEIPHFQSTATSVVELGI